METHDDHSARLKVKNLEIEDYFTLDNALVDGPSVEAEVSFECRWHHVLGTQQITNADPMQRFTGKFTRTFATVKWSGREDGFEYHTDPGSETVLFAEIGRERNGVFFK